MAGMRRPDFIAAAAGAAAWPIAARAQPACKRPIIGFLGTDAVAWRPWIDAFVVRLRELGWIEGRTIAFEYRWFEGRPERNTEIAAEFIRLKVDVIVTNATAVPTLKQATAIIPIVFPLGPDPIGGGLVTSLAQPGGNVTGLSIQSTDLAAKRVEFLREVVPGLRLLAIIVNVDNPASVREMREVSAAARTLGLQVDTMEIRRAEDIARAFAALKVQVDALYVVTDALATASASSRLRSARGCPRFPITAIGSNPGGSCPTEQTSPPNSGAPPS